MNVITDINLNKKKVLIRCDLNVPILDGKIIDDYRIRKSIPTIKYALDNAYRVIIISHLGRINTKDDLSKNSLKIVCDRLSTLIKENIKFCSYDDDIQKQINENKIIMLENTRYFDLNNKKESNNDKSLSSFFASLADVYINDAFAVCHRNAASTTGVSKILPSAIGFLVQEELEKLSVLYNPDKPFNLILGGSKVSDKIGIISNLIDKVNNIIVVGAMAFTFFKAQKINIGKSVCDDEHIDYCKDLLNKYGNKIILPKDIYVSDNVNSKTKKLVDIHDIKDNEMGLDIGIETINNINNVLSDSKTVFLNGPAGMYENDTFSYGTIELFNILSKLDAKVIIGGGDSSSAAINLGYVDCFYHISTGGGATLEYLSGKNLPGLQFIGDKYEKI